MRMTSVILSRMSRSAPLKALTSGPSQTISAVCHVNEIAGLEVDEQDAGLRVEDDVADRVEVIVSGEVRKHEGAIVLDLDEARLASAVGDVSALV